MLSLALAIELGPFFYSLAILSVVLETDLGSQPSFSGLSVA